MRDYHSSCVDAGYQSPLYFLTQFLQNQSSNHSLNLTPDGEVLMTEPRERKSALVVDDVADVTEMLAVVLSAHRYHLSELASAYQSYDAQNAYSG